MFKTTLSLLFMLLLLCLGVQAQDDAEFDSLVISILADLAIKNQVPDGATITLEIYNESKHNLAAQILNSVTTKLECTLIAQKFLVAIQKNYKHLLALHKLYKSVLFENQDVPKLGHWRPAKVLIIGSLGDKRNNRLVLQLYLVDIETGVACGCSQKVIRMPAPRPKPISAASGQEDVLRYERYWHNLTELEKRTQKHEKRR
mgnify:CR=1 FL=1